MIEPVFSDDNLFYSWSRQDHFNVNKSARYIWDILTYGRTTAVDEVLSIEGAKDSTAYFYCSFTNDESLDLMKILGSLLAQLCGSTDTYEKIKSKYDKECKKGFGKAQNMDTDQIVALIIEIIRDRGSAFIFIDAVNECSDPHEILTPLKIIATSCDNVHMFLSSINEKGIEGCLQEMPELIIETLHPPDMKNDIKMLVQANLETHPRLRHHTPQLKQEITLALTQGAQGM